MSEIIKKDNNLDPLTCEIWVNLVEQLRYSTFISTKELEKLSTCHNLDKLENYFQLEKEILQIIFAKNPRLKKEKSFTHLINITPKNIKILGLIESYVSMDYIRRNTKEFKDENISWIKLYFETDSKNRVYISDIEVISK